MSSNPQTQNPSSRLNGLVAIVTGGASMKGFGYAIAQRYLSEGCRVLVADIDSALADSVAMLEKSSSPEHVLAHRLDVTSQNGWKEAVQLCLDRWDRLDIVVNNAGTTYRNKSTLEVEEEEFLRVFDVNVKSIFWSIKVAVPAIKRGGRGGSIINISSTGAIRPRPGLVWYNASKGAVSNATMSLAAEFGPDQIRVNAICPLLSATALFSQFTGMEDSQENRKKFSDSIPLQRLTDPMDIANAALFLASEEGKFVTGTNFPVDGGRCI